MKYYTIAPPPMLAKYVRYYWVLEADVLPGTEYIHRTMADGSAEMVFHYKGMFDELDVDSQDSYAPAQLHAQTQHFRRFMVGESFGIFGVYLYPFAIPAFFSMPSAALSNHMPGLDDVIGGCGKILEEKMMLAKDNQQRVQLISAFLLEQLRKRSPHFTTMHTAVQGVIATKGMINVQQLASSYCLSPRQFERKFKELSGFSPKKYARIIRFQAALMEYDHKHKSLTDIAYECGYYDQSHFIHDFREFSGYHPKQYFSGEAEGVEYRDV